MVGQAAKLSKNKRRRIRRFVSGAMVHTSDGTPGRITQLTNHGSVLVQPVRGGAAKSYPLYESFSNGELVPEDPVIKAKVLSYLGKYEVPVAPDLADRTEVVEPNEENDSVAVNKGKVNEVPPIDVVGNVRVRCFLQGVGEDELSFHLRSMGLVGFEVNLADGFDGRHSLQAIRETGKYLGCGSDALLATFDELLQQAIRWCDKEGWTFHTGGTKTVKGGRLERIVTIDGEGGKEVVVYAYRDARVKSGYDVMLCALVTKIEGQRAHSCMRFGVSHPSKKVIKLFDSAYDREKHENERRHKVKASDRSIPSQAANQSSTPAKTARPIHVNEFLVRKSYGTHRVNGHSLEPVLATVTLLPMAGDDPRPVEFNGYWCPKCQKYFMTEGTYLRLKRLGYICCKVVEEKDLETKKAVDDLYGNLAPESVLHMYGYTVNQQDNLSQVERQTIISFVIENRIQSAQDIAHLLEWLISQREGNPRMSVAVSRWRADLRFVRHYHKPTRKVRVDRIYAKI